MLGDYFISSSFVDFVSSMGPTPQRVLTLYKEEVRQIKLDAQNRIIKVS